MTKINTLYAMQQCCLKIDNEFYPTLKVHIDFSRKFDRKLTLYRVPTLMQ